MLSYGAYKLGFKEGGKNRIRRMGRGNGNKFLEK